MAARTGQLAAEKKFSFPSATAAQSAAKAIKPELAKPFGHRAKAGIHTNKNLVLLRIVAKDSQALNASLGSFSRLLSMCREIAFMEE